MTDSNSNNRTLQTNNVIEIRKVVDPTNGSVVKKEQSVIQTVGCDKIVMKTSYRGPQGPKGDTSMFNDLDIPSLSQRFLNKLV
jgi:hypothetical protein